MSASADPTVTGDPSNSHDLAPYDAVLLVSFGGPEAPDEVLPFLERVTVGRGIPADRLAEVGEHYYRFGGRSPINDQNRSLLRRLREEMDRRGLGTPLAWGNRNAAPLLDDVVPQLVRSGHRRILALTTSAYPSYSSCRQYRENLFDSVHPVGDGVRIDRIRNYATHPAFVEAWTDRVDAAWDELSTEGSDRPRLVYVTHSIPAPMAASAGPSRAGLDPTAAAESGNPGEYELWHRGVAAAVTHAVVQRRGLPDQPHDLVYCSRSGPPSQPWLGPDVNDHLERLAGEGVRQVILAPIGFISDHMEVIYDLDTEARETADRLGLWVARARTVSEHPAFVAMLVDLLMERASVARGEHPERPSLPGLAPGPDICPARCCPNLRRPGRPALCQTPVHPPPSKENADVDHDPDRGH